MESALGVDPTQPAPGRQTSDGQEATEQSSEPIAAQAAGVLPFPDLQQLQKHVNDWWSQLPRVSLLDLASFGIARSPEQAAADAETAAAKLAKAVLDGLSTVGASTSRLIEGLDAGLCDIVDQLVPGQSPGTIKALLEQQQQQHAKAQAELGAAEGRLAAVAAAAAASSDGGAMQEEYLVAVRALGEAQRRVDALARENEVLRAASASDPMQDAIQAQLQALLADKASLQAENTRLARENAGLHELLHYSEALQGGDDDDNAQRSDAGGSDDEHDYFGEEAGREEHHTHTSAPR